MSFQFRWSVTPEQAFGDLAEAYIAAIRAGVLAIANRRAPEITEWMKQNAPWQDITGAARASLLAEVIQMGTDMTEIFMSQGVHYGYFLELSNAGRYSILAPALDQWAPIVWQDVLAMLRP